MAVAVVVPTLAALLIRREPPSAKREEQEEGGIGFLHASPTACIGHVARRPRRLRVAGLAAVVLTGLAYIRLEPHYRLADQVPDKEQALAATGRLDQKLTGANPVHVMIQWKGGRVALRSGRR